MNERLLNNSSTKVRSSSASLLLSSYSLHVCHIVSVESIAYLLALKLIAPRKVHLLRGNHELEGVNGDTKTYVCGRGPALMSFVFVHCSTAALTHSLARSLAHSLTHSRTLPLTLSLTL